MADFDPSGSQKPWTNFDETCHGWLRPGPHPTWVHDNFGVGSETWVVWANMWLITSRSFFFSFFFAFFSALPGHISWPIGTIYTPKRVFPAKDVLFWGHDNMQLYLGSTPPPQKKKNSPKWAGIGISQPNRQCSKIAIYRSVTNKDIRIIFHRQIQYR